MSSKRDRIVQRLLEMTPPQSLPLDSQRTPDNPTYREDMPGPQQQQFNRMYRTPLQIDPQAIQRPEDRGIDPLYDPNEVSPDDVMRHYYGAPFIREDA